MAGRTRLVVCYVCGREFGSQSIGIHEPKCLEKWHATNAQLPRPQQRPPPQKPQLPQSRDMRGSRDQWNEAAYRSAQGALAACENCGRTFNPDRLAVHQRSCRPGNGTNKPIGNKREGDRTRVLAPTNRIDVGNHPVPSMSRGASTLSNYGESSGSRARSYDDNGYEGQRSTPMQRKTVPAKQGTLRLTPSRSQGLPSEAASRTGGNGRGAMSQSRTTGVRQSRQPKFVFCYICGRQFTDASLPIHEPQCLQKWEVQNSLLPPNERRPRPKKPEILGAKAGGMTREELMEAQWQAAKENMVPCRNCGRRFVQDRIGVHERICKGLKNGPAPAASVQFGGTNSSYAEGGGGGRGKTMTRSMPSDGDGGSKPKPAVRQSRQPKFVFCYICGRQFTDASLPIHEPQCLQKWEVQNNQLPPNERRPRPKKPEILSGGNTKGLTREELQEAQWQAAKANLVECANCGRRFASDRIGVHERICKGLKHGPPPGAKSEQFDSTAAAGNDYTPPSKGKGTAKSAHFADSANTGEPMSDGGYKVPAKPRTVVCYICGREFGSKSIDIHQPQCLQKWHAENDRLPPNQRRPEPRKPQEMPISGRGGGYDRTAMNDAAFQAAMDNRVACSNCGRKFNADRVAVHERSCRPMVREYE